MMTCAASDGAAIDRSTTCIKRNGTKVSRPLDAGSYRPTLSRQKPLRLFWPLTERRHRLPSARCNALLPSTPFLITRVVSPRKPIRTWSCDCTTASAGYTTHPTVDSQPSTPGGIRRIAPVAQASPDSLLASNDEIGCSQHVASASQPLEGPPHPSEALSPRKLSPNRVCLSSNECHRLPAAQPSQKDLIESLSRRKCSPARSWISSCDGSGWAAAQRM